LSQYSTVEKPLSEKKALFYFLQLIDAVSYCHTEGVCHRDLKLENLLLDNNGNLKITDFGHAGIFPKGWDVFSPELVGSLFHLSPEQIQGQAYLGHKVDTWAIGVLLFRLVAGVHPFQSNDPNEFVSAVTEGRFSLPEIMSEDLKDLLKRILRVNPEDRISLDDMKSHPWCKGATKKPNLMRQKVNFLPGVAIDGNWNHLKHVLQQMNIHYVETYTSSLDPKDQSPDVKVLKCTCPAKYFKFKVEFRLNRKEQSQFDFRMKEGCCCIFRKTVGKVRERFLSTPYEPTPGSTEGQQSSPVPVHSNHND